MGRNLGNDFFSPLRLILDILIFNIEELLSKIFSYYLMQSLYPKFTFVKD